MDDDGAPLVLDELARALADLPPIGPWVLEASCAQLGFEGAAVFVAEGRLDLEELAVAEAVCRRCPVRQKCSDYAAEAPVWGMWAGVWHGRPREGAPGRIEPPHSASRTSKTAACARTAFR